MGKTGETGIAEGFFERSIVRYEDSTMKNASDGKTSKCLDDKATERTGWGGVGAGKEGRCSDFGQVGRRSRTAGMKRTKVWRGCRKEELFSPNESVSHGACRVQLMSCSSCSDGRVKVL